MPAGRPTKYNDEMQERAEDYLVNFRKYGDAVPIVEGLALELGVDPDTLRNWADKHPAFFGTLQAVKLSQCRNLLNGGLDGTHNTAITKLMLANHNYTEKSQVENTGTTTTIIVESKKDADALGELDGAE